MKLTPAESNISGPILAVFKTTFGHLLLELELSTVPDGLVLNFLLVKSLIDPNASDQILFGKVLPYVKGLS